MKLKMPTLASAGLFFVIGGGLTGCKSAAVDLHKFDTADSPINMGGGSIYGSIKPGRSWTKISGKQSREYTTTSTNIDLLFVDGVQNAPSPIPSLPDGWKILIASNDTNQDAVTICPEQDCKAGALSGKQTIYITTGKGSRWTLSPRNNQLRYHDNECDGDDENGTSEEPDCDFLMKVTILDSKGNTVASGTCQDSSGIYGRCLIGIGKP